MRLTVSWKLKLFVKLAFQKVIGVHPTGPRLQEWMKRKVRGSSKLGAAFFVENIRGKVAHFTEMGIAPPKKVVEQGTGWHGRDLVFFYLAGADEIATYDTMGWLDEDMFRECAGYASEMAEEVVKWPGVSADLVRERAQELISHRHLPLKQQLARMNVTANVKRTFDRGELASGTYDLMYSDSVLQRMLPADLHQLNSHAQRFLKEDGHAYHIIDSKDFHAINSNVPFLHYLTWSDSAWRLITSRYLNYQNRWRMPQFVEAFAKAGFQVQIFRQVVHQENIDFVTRHLSGDPRYANMDRQEVAVSAFDLLGRKSDLAKASSQELETMEQV